MICRHCGGQVVWVGQLTNVDGTECQDCGRTNCQELDVDFQPDEEREDEQQSVEP